MWCGVNVADKWWKYTMCGQLITISLASAYLTTRKVWAIIYGSQQSNSGTRMSSILYWQFIYDIVYWIWQPMVIDYNQFNILDKGKTLCCCNEKLSMQWPRQQQLINFILANTDPLNYAQISPKTSRLDPLGISLHKVWLIGNVLDKLKIDLMLALCKVKG